VPDAPGTSWRGRAERAAPGRPDPSAREGLAERRFGGHVYRVGDKLMQIKNNYDKGTAGVFNGSVGVVTTVSLEDQELRVRLDEDRRWATGSTSWMS
jgi:ATP-dependent exoDNAse (exonuclease V) alpha subunit